MPKTSSNFSSSVSRYNEKYSCCLQPFDLAVSWDIAATAKYAGDLSAWFSSKVKRAFHLRLLRNVSSCLIYWGTLFCGAHTWWVTPLCPKHCGGHRERGFHHSNCSPQTDPLLPEHPCTQTPPATAGNERPMQMKPQMLQICGFPSIHAVLLQNV